MASRESQGLQIALIVFVMVTVLLAVMTFFFYRRSEEFRKTAEAAKQSETAARNTYSTENFKVQYLKHILGAARLADAEFKSVRDSVLADEEMKSVDDQYQQHMKTYGEGLSPEKLDYANLLPNMMMALRARNKANADLSAQVNQLTEEKRLLQDNETKRTEQAVEGLKQAKDDLATERDGFQKSRDTLAAQQQDQLKTFQTHLAKLTGEVDAVKKADEAREKLFRSAQIVIEEQKKKLTEGEPRSFETADGQVTWVNQRSGMVWINLGTADGLPRQTMFSVFGQDQTGVDQAERKAAIEVTRVLDDHLSEARIVADNPGDPILPGDQIFSPAWRKGEKVHFALAGILDVDGDGRSDRELVLNLITSNGGEVDAEVNEAGEATGQITSSTRYLVLGDAPTDRKALEAWSKIIKDAEQLGVERMQMKRFLTLMGYERAVRSIPLGVGGRAEDFRAKPGEGRAPTSTGNVSDAFKERRPPASSTPDSAF